MKLGIFEADCRFNWSPYVYNGDGNYEESNNSYSFVVQLMLTERSKGMMEVVSKHWYSG